MKITVKFTCDVKCESDQQFHREIPLTVSRSGSPDGTIMLELGWNAESALMKKGLGRSPLLMAAPNSDSAHASESCVVGACSHA